MEKIWNAKDLSEVQPDFISETNFMWYFQNQLQIKSDQKTIIGMMNDGRKNLFNIRMEDITGRNKR